jgi:membrane protease YdiL (CAAX protease family)
LEVLWVYAGVTAATVAISLAGRWPPLFDYVHLAVGALFLLTALQLAQRRPGGLARYGLSLGGLLEPADEAEPGVRGMLEDLMRALWRAAPHALREGVFALLLALLIFPPFSVAFYLWHVPEHAFSFTPPPELASYVVSQLLVVALPEEALFRGYLQGRLEDAERRRARLLGVQVAPRAFLLQAVLFALIHVAVDHNPARLAVFFPALLFGWVRARRGGVGAAIVLHAASNLLSDILVRGWL